MQTASNGTFGHCPESASHHTMLKLTCETFWPLKDLDTFTATFVALEACLLPPIQEAHRIGTYCHIGISEKQKKGGKISAQFTCSRGGCPVSSSLLSSFLAWGKSITSRFPAFCSPLFIPFLHEFRQWRLLSAIVPGDAAFLCGASMSYIAFSTSRASSSSPRCLNLINLDNLVFAKSLCEIYWSIYKFILFTYLSMCVCVCLFVYLFL